MDEFFAQLIANVAEARAKRENARKAQFPGGDGRRPLPQTVSPGLATAPAPSRPANDPARVPPRRDPSPTPVTSPAAQRVAAFVSAIEASDPFAAVAAAQIASTPAASALLAAFSGRDGLLAGIVLSETLAPPLALRPERNP